MRRTASGGMNKLETTDEVIEALGGPDAVKSITDATSSQQVFNWRERGFPARLYLVMQTELERRGFSAPAKLWGVMEPRGAVSEETHAAV